MARLFRGAAQWHGEKGFVSNNDVIDRLEWDQDHSTSVISRNSLKPSVHYGTEPLFLRLASSLVFNPAPKAFWGTNPAKSRLFHPELNAEPDLGERLILPKAGCCWKGVRASLEHLECSCVAYPGLEQPRIAAAVIKV